MSASNPLDAGKEALKVGDLAKAVLFFEAAVRRRPDNAECWQYLGGWVDALV